MSEDEITRLLARAWRPIGADTPRDRPITVFMPARRIFTGKNRGKHKAHIIRAIWFQDDREERSERRHDLMMKHDGFWATAKPGNKPLPYHPTHWLPSLPFPEGYVDDIERQA